MSNNDHSKTKVDYPLMTSQRFVTPNGGDEVNSHECVTTEKDLTESNADFPQNSSKNVLNMSNGRRQQLEVISMLQKPETVVNESP